MSNPAARSCCRATTPLLPPIAVNLARLRAHPSSDASSTGTHQPLGPGEPAEIDADLVARIDGIADGKRLSSLPELDDVDISRLSDELADLERELSLQRRALHERIDVLQEELVRRYKTGEASVDSLLK